ncbi:XRE family transcriptional regulator [Desertivirga xinjiangensis]|uniref:XRE family transcriptional regulator n=1 Tax=Desertivirga xinjiangensis TaxID=539206 RepID=UPI00210C2221|nr:helix-turn-helix transcriptional regulator [Pedobacter xinjiangensis]
MHQGEFIKRLLKERQITQDKLAEDINISRGHIVARLKEPELINDKADTRKKILKYLNLTDNDLPTVSAEEKAEFILKQHNIDIHKLQVTNEFKVTPRRSGSNATLIGDLNEEEFGEDTKFKNVGNGWFSMKVELVTEKAKAGFLRGFADTEFHEELPFTEVLVDFYHAGKYLAFESKGDSMDNGDINEAIPDKTIIIGRELEQHKWKPRLYDHKWPNWIFIHRTEGILVKQIKEQNLEEGWILHTSLNPNKNLYPDEKIYLKDIYKIYNVVKRILR